jgi:hypothetical protein
MRNCDLWKSRLITKPNQNVPSLDTKANVFIPEDRIIRNHHWENLKSYLFIVYGVY